MARETRAQKHEREMQSREREKAKAFERWQLMRAEWFNKVMVELERASKFDFEIEVVKKTNGEFGFVVTYPIEDWTVFSFTSVLPEQQDMSDIYSLEDLQDKLNLLEKKELEEERKRKLIETALSKLSEEEREVLGI